MNSGFNKKLLGTAIVLAMGGMLGGCNDGGDVTSLTTTDTPTTTDTTATSTALTGTAAGGAAIIGTVTVKDSTGKQKSSLIDSNGRYTVDVSDMTAPFVMRADGQVGDTRVTYYSAATSAGNVNITQFTELIVANVANQLAESFYANFTTEAGNLTGEALDTAETALQAKLQPVLSALGLDASIDLLRASFAADHSGLDAALDLVRVSYDVNTNTASLVDTLNNAVLGTDDVTTNADDSAALDPTNVAALVADAQTAVTAATDIDTWFKNFTTLFATSLPSEAELSASGLIDTSSYFMERGLSYSELAYELTTDAEVVGITASNTSITFLNPEQTKARVSVQFTFKNMVAETTEFQLEKRNGAWIYVGDQRMAEIEITAFAGKNTNLINPSATQFYSGLHIWLDAESYNAKANLTTADTVEPIAYAVVKGPGLPTAGVRMSQPDPVAFFTVEGGYGNQVPDCAVGASTCVTVADTVDNGEYTVTVYKADASPLDAPYVLKMVSRKPLATGDLTDSMFPAVTSVNGAALTSIADLTSNATLNIAWTLPDAMVGDHLNVWATSSVTGERISIEEELTIAQTSASLALGDTSVLMGPGLYLSANDAGGRIFSIMMY